MENSPLARGYTDIFFTVWFCMSVRLRVCVCGLQCGWYWGAMSFDEAEAMLASRRDGSFLVRDSSDERYILSLSFRSLGGTHHTRIEHYKGTVVSRPRLTTRLARHVTATDR